MAHVPRKRFGQHFLTDKETIAHIIDVISPKPEEHLIEIGPGQGALTLPVLKIAKQLTAIELDRDLIEKLKTASAPLGTLTLYSADVLNFDFEILKQDTRLLRIFGNLPYNISTPLIFHLLTFHAIIADMCFMLQKEVAERLAATPNTAHYGRLSVMIQYHLQVMLLFDVPPDAFRPPPKVTSTIVRLIPHETRPYTVNNYPLFATIVREAFGQRRKTLRNSLKTYMSDAMWSVSHLHPDARAENLSVSDFVILANQIEKG
ncbi:MAG TPA: 16S rRNA (adenine(1518)-N(6)/adenine(1519)-N(6))-dimethyltransferase RsmA [Gammaproteobacteria bacterium]|jgi:16S rRNA (adenine1518-N6/adenine1519-N6)-dimethyltransferase|nr:16S rRNA (adenine(1518)-N(6)/adenine(1519)-N(6))-dimethyltransferase RsmA [Gammaproteobacteria bacterium]